MLKIKTVNDHHNYVLEVKKPYNFFAVRTKDEHLSFKKIPVITTPLRGFNRLLGTIHAFPLDHRLFTCLHRPKKTY